MTARKRGQDFPDSVHNPAIGGRSIWAGQMRSFLGGFLGSEFRASS
jgi:hypothetical protein